MLGILSSAGFALPGQGGGRAPSVGNAEPGDGSPAYEGATDASNPTRLYRSSIEPRLGTIGVEVEFWGAEEADTDHHEGADARMQLLRADLQATHFLRETHRQLVEAHRALERRFGVGLPALQFRWEYALNTHLLETGGEYSRPRRMTPDEIANLPMELHLVVSALGADRVPEVIANYSITDPAPTLAQLQAHALRLMTDTFADDLPSRLERVAELIRERSQIPAVYPDHWFDRISIFPPTGSASARVPSEPRASILEFQAQTSLRPTAGRSAATVIYGERRQAATSGGDATTSSEGGAPVLSSCKEAMRRPSHVYRLSQRTIIDVTPVSITGSP